MQSSTVEKILHVLHGVGLTSLDLLVLVLIGQVVIICLEHIEQVFAIVIVSQREKVRDLVLLLDQIQSICQCRMILAERQGKEEREKEEREVVWKKG